MRDMRAVDMDVTTLTDYSILSGIPSSLLYEHPRFHRVEGVVSCLTSMWRAKEERPDPPSVDRPLDDRGAAFCLQTS